MREKLAGLAVAGFFTLGGVVQGQVLIGGSVNNGNMDKTYAQEVVPGFFLPKPAIWINEASRTISGPYEDELTSESWAGPAPTPVTTDASGLPSPNGVGAGQLDAGVFWKPFSGNVINGPATGHLYQDHPALPGMLYTFSGWAGAESNVLMSDAQLAIEFLDAGNNVLPGSEVLSLLPTLFIANGQPFGYKEYSLDAIAPGGAVTVRARISMIGAMGNPLGGGQAFVVDDFTLAAAPIPEPSTGVLAVLGMAGLLSRRVRERVRR